MSKATWLYALPSWNNALSEQTAAQQNQQKKTVEIAVPHDSLDEPLGEHNDNMDYAKGRQ